MFLCVSKISKESWFANFAVKRQRDFIESTGILDSKWRPRHAAVHLEQEVRLAVRVPVVAELVAVEADAPKELKEAIQPDHPSWRRLPASVHPRAHHKEPIQPDRHNSTSRALRLKRHPRLRQLLRQHRVTPKRQQPDVEAAPVAVQAQVLVVQALVAPKVVAPKVVVRDEVVLAVAA